MATNLNAGLNFGLNPGLRQSISGGVGALGLFRSSSLDLRFADKGTLTDRVSGNNLITFSRASSGTYVGSDGLIKTSAVNLFTYSEQFESWDAGSNTTVIPNAALAPDGSMTADKIYLPEAGGTYIRQLNATVGIENTFSIWVKAVTPGTNDKFNIQIGDFSSSDFTSTEEWQRFSFTTTPLLSKAAIFNEGDNFISNIYVWGAQLEEGTTATDYIPTGATISGAPRFDHDPVTGESLGLLIEEGRTNLFTYSEQFDQWVKGSNTTVTANAAVAPDGTLTADRVQNPSQGSTFIGNGTITNGITYTVSVYAKAVTPGTDDKFTFNLGGGLFNASSQFTATNEWQRFTFTHTPTSTSQPVINNEGDGFVTDVYFWGAQLETGTFPTSYIPTTNSTVTRSPDIATIEGTNFSSWYNQSEGTVFTETKVNRTVDVGGTSIWRVGSNVRCFYRASGDIGTNTVTTSLTFLNTDGVTTFTKTAIAIKANDHAGSNSDDNLRTASSSTPATGSELFIGCTDAGLQLNGHISRLAYFPTRKTDQELIKITDGTLYTPAITYGITSAGGTFNLRSTGTVDYAVDWDSTGGYESSTSNALAHTYTAGNYNLVVYSNDVYRPYFNNVTADVSQITSVVIGAGADFTGSLANAWYGANNMTSFVCPFGVTSGVTSFSSSWRTCNSLTSFPLIDTSSGTSFGNAWRNCNSLTSFPLIDTSSGTSFGNAWRDCSNLTSFPLIDTAAGTNFKYTWYNCNSLTSFPANMFDTTGTLISNAFNLAWSSCALTAQSIENILVSLDTNGASNITLSISGGTNAGKTTWSAAANTAYDSLIVKGWTISFNA